VYSWVDGHHPTSTSAATRAAGKFKRKSNLAQWKRAGLITRRSHDRNVQLLLAYFLFFVLFPFSPNLYIHLGLTSFLFSLSTFSCYFHFPLSLNKGR
ncbi:hypothetical protein CCMA1212_002222, partial [Trichoderma ghanense]